MRVPIPDASVLIAGADHHHKHHKSVEPTLVAVRERGQVIAQSLNECFLALTCTGAATPRAALAYLEQFTANPPIGIAPADHPAALRELAELGVSGGALYDGLVALAAREANKPLFTNDPRAVHTYDRCGVEYSLVA